MKENRFQRVLREGGLPAGHMVMEFGSRGLAKILAAADVDFVIIDMEHSGFDTERIADLVAWFKATEIAPGDENVQGSELRGGFIIPLIALVAIILGIIAATRGNNDDLPHSP